MLRTRNDQPTLWESVLPPELMRLPEELARVDSLLDDEAFFAPFRYHFDPIFGRPSIPIETYLRLMFLKFRYRLGCESVCAEVTDSISWRRFCRIGIDGKVPHPTTLMKITTRCGSEVIEQLNEALLAKAAQAKLLRVGKVRADTTVVSANADYPTDLSLLAKAVRRIGRIVRRVKAAGAATRTRCPDHSRAASRGARQIASKLRLRGPQAKEEAKRLIAKATATVARLAQTSAHDAEAVPRNARRALRTAAGRRAGRLRRAVNELAATIEITTVVVAQARSRLAGVMPDSATRVVSLHDRDARPVVRGRIGKPVEFGYNAQVVDNTDGIILDYTVEQGNPPDAPQLAPAVARITAGPAGHPAP
jgi:IS5 family transposase